jgi:hypothetical protein
MTNSRMPGSVPARPRRGWFRRASTTATIRVASRSGVEHRSNSLKRTGAIKILGVLRRLLSRVAPSELLRMTQGKKYGWKQAEGRRIFCCGEPIDACAAPPGLDSFSFYPPFTASLTLAYRVGSIIPRLRRWVWDSE